MDIERVNENTLKVFMTYRDIEARGYSREEIWYNRTKGEELFWDMIGEINTEEYFDLDGPIWIHVNASEHGLEVIVTRANTSDNESSGLAFDDESVDKLDDEVFGSYDGKDNLENQAVPKISIYKFKDIDEIIPLAKRMTTYGVPSSLYRFEDKYYLAVDFADVDVDFRTNLRSIISEYFAESKLTIYRLQEYGDVIMEENCFDTILQYFD